MVHRDRTEAALELARRLLEAEQRLAAAHREVANLKKAFKRAIAGSEDTTSDNAIESSEPLGIYLRIIDILDGHPHRVFTAADLDQMMESKYDINSIYSALSRLASQGRIERLARAQYRSTKACD